MPGVRRRLSEAGGYAVGNYLGGPIGGTVGAYLGGRASRAIEGPSRQAFSNESTLSSRNAIAKKKGAKLNKKNQKKSVKVSSALRKKISKVIEEKKIHGSWTQISFGHLDRPTSNAQSVQAIQQQAAITDFGGGWDFLPEVFLHCASVLFNGKTDTQGSREVTNSSNLGMINLGEGQSAGQNVYGCNAQFVVNKSWVAYHMKNNTQQTLKVRAYTISIKSPQSFFANAVVDTTGGLTTNQITNLSPIDNWVASLAVNTGQNVLAADINRIGMRPESDPKFKQLFNYSVTEIIMDPGQTHTCNVTGPSAEKLDYTKYYLNGQFMTLQKYSRYTFFIIETDLIQGGTDTSNTVGRFKLGGTGKLLLERKFHMGISVPESAGIRFSSASSLNQSVETNYRKPVFGHAVYSAASPTTLQRIDELQPATLES